MTKLTAVSTAVLIALACVGPWANAQQAPGSMKEAIERAILQNPEVKLRFHNLEAAKSERGAAQGAWLPRIDLEIATGAYQTKSPAFPSALGYNGNRASPAVTANLVRRFCYLE